MRVLYPCPTPVPSRHLVRTRLHPFPEIYRSVLPSKFRSTNANGHVSAPACEWISQTYLFLICAIAHCIYLPHYAMLTVGLPLLTLVSGRALQRSADTYADPHVVSPPRHGTVAAGAAASIQQTINFPCPLGAGAPVRLGPEWDSLGHTSLL